MGRDVATVVHIMESETGVTCLSLALLIGFWVCAYGWGRLFASFFPVPLLRLKSVSAVIGLGILNVIGGWLNIAKLASTPFLMALMLAGLVFAGVGVVRRPPWKRAFRCFRRPESGGQMEKCWRTATAVTVWPVLASLAAGVISCALLVPTFGFNYHDDFQTYIPRAVRMVQTGTLAGNPFDPIGVDSLGSQSFFHGFFLPNTDVRMLHAFDAVGCFALALLVIAEVSIYWRLPAKAGVLAVIMVVAINPQCVNVSPLYSGILVAITLVIVGATWATGLTSSRPQKHYRHELMVGLLAALLITLKPTLAFFAGLYLIALYMVALWAGAPRRALGRSAMTLAAAIIAFAAPWLLLHLATIRRARNLAAAFSNEAILAEKYHDLAAHGIPQLLSLRPLFWGDSLASYHFVALVCLGAATAACIFWRRSRIHPRAYGLLSVSAAGTAALGSYLLNAHLFFVEDGTRYSCPTLIACSVTGLLCLLRFSRIKETEAYRAFGLGVCCVMVVVIAVFNKSLFQRALLAARSRTILAFPLSSIDWDHCETTLSRLEGLNARRLQQKMEPGSKALVWTAAPFHFDFARNRLLTASEPGFINPATSIPAGISTDALRRYLSSWGIRYVLLQEAGLRIKTVETLSAQLDSDNAVFRKLADYGIYFRISLMILGAQSKTLYYDGRTLLFEISSSQAPISEAKTAARPNYAEAYLQMALIYHAQQKFSRAIEHYQTAMRLTSGQPLLLKNYASALAEAGRLDEAVEQFTTLLKTNLNDPEAHTLLAAALAGQRRTAEAIHHHRAALRLAPDSPELLNNLAWILATNPKEELRNSAEAVTLAERACDLTQRKQPMFLGTLAAAYAEAGRFENAIETARKAAALARASRDQELVATNEKLLALYQAGQAYHEPAKPTP